MKKVFILGNKGNMGQRYAAVLKHLGHVSLGLDRDDNLGDYIDDIISTDAIIIATPTSLHLDDLYLVTKFRKPILCEKPFINKQDQLSHLQDFLLAAKDLKAKITMVSQYDYMKVGREGNSLYNYYKTGNDGLAWDCINVIWQAKGKITLKNDSPIWTCVINQWPQRIELMDYAYVQMIKEWLEKPYEAQYDRILNAHQKVVDYLDGKFN
jgi:hypothetical protein